MREVRGIRGANGVDRNNRDSILVSTKELLEKIILENDLEPENIISIFFTATDDLNAEYPAYAAREMGLTMVPLLCAREMNVPGSMKQLIRVLIHVNTEKKQNEIKHQYLGETKHLRPDIAKGEDNGCRCHEE